MDNLMNTLSKVEAGMNEGIFPTILNIFEKYKIDTTDGSYYFPFSKAFSFVGYDTMVCIGLIRSKQDLKIKAIYLDERKNDMFSMYINLIPKEDFLAIYDSVKKVEKALEDL
jgi:hypothetical protein